MRQEWDCGKLTLGLKAKTERAVTSTPANGIVLPTNSMAIQYKFP